MIQSNPPRAEARRLARAEAAASLLPETVFGAPNRAARRAREEAAPTPDNGRSNRDNALPRKRRAARIAARRRAGRADA